MAKAGRGADQYMLRLPDGLRDRIKAYAERRGTSINSEIVSVLEREFPAPATLEQKISQLRGGLYMFQRGLEMGITSPNEGVDDLLSDVRETLEGIATGRVMDIDESVRQEVRKGLQHWLEDIGELKRDEPLKPLDPERIKAIQQGLPEKF